MECAQRVRQWARKIPRTIATIEDLKQLIRSSASVGANYIEANEALSKKDCARCLKICRKEARESEYWLLLLNIQLPQDLEDERRHLENEAHELKLIFNAIIHKYYSKPESSNL